MGGSGAGEGGPPLQGDPTEHSRGRVPDADKCETSESTVNQAKVQKEAFFCQFRESPSPRKEEVLTVPTVPAALECARDLFALSLAWPVMLLYLDFSLEGCRSRMQRHVCQGSAQVVRLQQSCRSKLGDWYFTIWAFFADQDFFMLAVPVLAWNIDYRFARHLTYVITMGFLWGNLLKDLFRLPRPRDVEPKVWVPKHVVGLDSTSCCDGGFPSTHAMSAVSNSLFTMSYCWQHQTAASSMVGPMLAMAAVWICSICFGRLYLGVHSPMDVKAGMLQGCFVAFIAQRPLFLCEQFDKWCMTSRHVPILLLLLVALVLLLHPQPRPSTPTFMTSCLLSGLFYGCTMGFLTEASRKASAGILGSSQGSKAVQALRVGSNDIGLPLLVARTFIGLMLVLSVKHALKALFIFLFQSMGLELSPAKPEAKGPAKVRELQGWDLWAAAVTKTSVYAAVAWIIMSGCPIFFDAMLGLPVEALA